ncbi:UNVERIFIED_CONTAM: hypothetical protein RMT77_011274 [Armadillidium vulgare]
MSYQSKICIRTFIVFAVILCHTHTHAVQLIDLGHDLGPETPIFPVPYNIPFEFTKKEVGYSELGTWTAIHNIRLSENIGTKVETPYRNNPNGSTIEEIPLRKLIGPAVVMDISEKVKTDPIYSMTATDVTDWISQNGAFPNNSIVLIYTGWSSRYPDATAYYGHATDVRKIRFPSVSKAALETILDHAKTNSVEISALGIDTGSPDLYPVTDVHTITAERNIYIIENLNDNLKNVPPKGAQLMVMPMKIEGGTGAPARVIATLPDTPKGYS